MKIELCPKGHQKSGSGSKRTLKSGEVRHYQICLECRRDRKKSYNARHPGRVKQSSRSTKLKAKYGISVAEYDALFQIQGGRCATCGEPPGKKPLFVDHKGDTVRGLLCERCNFAAGLMRDSPTIAAALGRYMDGIGFTRLIQRGTPMKITIESTTKKVLVDGVEARIWEGLTDSGVPIHCYVTRIAVHMNTPIAEIARFERELQEHRAPSADVQAIPLRLII
jgi:hypothetical protein